MSPMPLKNLPQYLKSLKEKGDTGSAPVVQMGQIITPKKKSYTNWSQNVILSTLLLMVMSVGGIMTYDMYNMASVKQFTVIVDMDNGINIPKIVSDSGGKVVAIEQNADSTYKVEVSTRKSKHSFLNWIRKNEDVKNVSLEE